MKKLTLVSGTAFMSIAFLLSGAQSAFAGNLTATIQSVTPQGGINPGQSVSFYTVATGFTNPIYSVADAFTGSSVSGASINASNGYFSWTPVIQDAGFHTITVTVTDTGGETSTASVAIVVLSNSISIGGLSPTSGTVAIGSSVTFSVTNPGFVNPLYFLTDTYAGSSVTNANISSTGVFSWTPTTNQRGVHTVTVLALDGVGHRANASQMITVLPPSVTIGATSPSGDIPVGTAVTFTATSVGFTTPMFAVTDAFKGSSIVKTNINPSGVFKWTPLASDAGTHVVTISVSDYLGNGTSTTATLQVVGTTTATTVQSATPAGSGTNATSSTPPASTTTKTTGDGYVFTTFLGIGSRGTGVTELQKRLTAEGLYAGPITTYFGPLTAAAVKQFQAAHNLSTVGYVGPGTRAALNK